MRAPLGSLPLVLIVLVAVVNCSSPHAASGTAAPVSSPPEARLQAVRGHLHEDGSGAEALALYPDFVLTYVDDGHGVQGKLNPAILPFKYYWSPSGRVTVAICGIGKTVFVCPFRLERLLTTDEFPRCDVAGAYSAPELAPSPPAGRPGVR